MREKQKTKPLGLFALFSLLSGVALYQTVCNQGLKQQSAELRGRLAAEKTTQIEEESKLARLPTEAELVAMRIDHAEAIRLRALTAKLKLDLDSRASDASRLIDKEESRWVRKWNFSVSVRFPKDQVLIQAGGRITPGKRAFAIFFPMIFADRDHIKIDSVWFEAPDGVIQSLGLNQTAASPDPDSGHYFLSGTEAETLLDRLFNEVTIKVVKPPGIMTSFGREATYSMYDPITIDSNRQINAGPTIKILPVHADGNTVQVTIAAEWKIRLTQAPGDPRSNL